MGRTQTHRVFQRMQAASAKQLRAATVKSARIDFRISETDKESIRQAAQDAGCTVSEYLLRLHYFASAKLQRNK